MRGSWLRRTVISVLERLLTRLAVANDQRYAALIETRLRRRLLGTDACLIASIAASPNASASPRTPDRRAAYPRWSRAWRRAATCNRSSEDWEHRLLELHARKDDLCSQKSARSMVPASSHLVMDVTESRTQPTSATSNPRRAAPAGRRL